MLRKLITQRPRPLGVALLICLSLTGLCSSVVVLSDPFAALTPGKTEAGRWL